MKKGGWLLLLAALVGCSDYPRDPRGTLERIRVERSFRVGLVARPGTVSASQRRFLEALGLEIGARPDLAEGSTEALLAAVEAGELDLVVGEFHSTTPWSSRVTFLPRIDGKGGEAMRLAAAARNGENAWIAVVHRHAPLLEAAR